MIKIPRVLLRSVLFLFFLEIFLRLGGMVSLSLQYYQNKSNLKDQHAYRIMCVGESTTFIGGKDSYPNQLQRVLNDHASAKTFEVINRGVPGSNSADLVAGLKKDLEFYRPDMVIAMVGANDNPNTPIYQDKWSDKFKVYLGDIRVLRVSKYLRLHIHNELGRLLRAGETRREFSVEERLRREVKSHPKAAAAYIELGQYLFEQKKYAEAEALFKRAVKVQPKKDWGYEQLAKTFVLQERFKQAEEVLLPALKNYPDKTWPYVSLSRFYQSQNRHNDAESVLKTGVEKNPANLEIYTALGEFYFGQRQFPLAQKVFQKLIFLDPGNGGIYPQLGFCYGEQGRYAQMDEIFDKAVDSSGPRVFLHLSNWYLNHDKPAIALAVLKKALSLDPADRVIARGIANVYSQMGLKELSQQYQRQIEDLGKDRPLPATASNYRKIVEIVQAQGVLMVSVSYANRDVADVKRMLAGLEGIFFVDNGLVFKQALANGRYDDYFSDSLSGDFGHCTPKGARLLADNIARSVLEIILKR